VHSVHPPFDSSDPHQSIYKSKESKKESRIPSNKPQNTIERRRITKSTDILTVNIDISNNRTMFGSYFTTGYASNNNTNNKSSTNFSSADHKNISSSNNITNNGTNSFLVQ